MHNPTVNLRNDSGGIMPMAKGNTQTIAIDKPMGRFVECFK